MILDQPDLRPGLCVHVGCGDGNLCLALSRKGHLVQGITTDERAVDGARKTIRAAGAYGRVSVTRVASMARLPYVPHLGNLIVVDDFAARAREGLTVAEVVRVLSPYGSAFLKNAGRVVEDSGATPLTGGWVRLVKPYPGGMAEFPDGSARTSDDELVGPPTALRWIAGEYWCGENAWGGTLAASAGGRVFYRFSVEQGYGMKSQYEQKMYRYEARDAFNGLKLWERVHPNNGYAMEFLEMFGDGLLVSRRPPTVLDPATGVEMELSPDAQKRIRERRPSVEHEGLRIFRHRLHAVDLKTGKELWRVEGWDYGGPVGDGKVFSNLRHRDQDGQKRVVGTCFDAKTGKKMWEQPAARFCLYRDGHLFTRQRGKPREIPDLERPGKRSTRHYVVIGAVSPEDGRPLWQREFPLPGHGGRGELWYMEGLAWVHVGFDDTSEEKIESWRGLDPRTGKTVRKIPMPGKVKHRCSPHHATRKYILANGMELFSPSEGRVYGFYGARNACGLGYIPANGMLYNAPTVCECFPHLRGITAVAADSIPTWKQMRGRAGSDFHKGPAFGKPAALQVAESDWPTYRHDSLRSGSTTASVPVDLAVVWTASFGKRISSPTVAGGLVFVSAIDEHRVVALDATTGQEHWTYVTGSRVDTPPTIYKGRVLFGGRDGWVYCLSADRGELAWKFRAAPEDKRIVERGMVESAWPLFGTVCVVADLAVVAAGRHAEVDGGIFLYGLDPATGEVRWRRHVVRENPLEQTSRGKIGTEMNDVLSGDATAVLMHRRWFDPRTGGEPKGTSRFTMTGGTPGWIADIAGPPIGWKHDFQQERRGPGLRATIISHLNGRSYAIDKDEAEIRCVAGKKTVWAIKTPQNTRQKALLVTPETVFVSALPDDADFSRGEIWAYSTESGEDQGRLKLPGAPAFEGLAATPGRLFVATHGGQLVCFGRPGN